MSTKALFRLLFTALLIFLLGCNKPEEDIPVGNTTPADAIWSDPGVIINEIMFNAPVGGVDYIELKHAGTSPVNLNGLWIASMNEDGSVAKKYKISERSGLLYSGEYKVLTTDRRWLCKTYSCDSTQVIQMNVLPAMNNNSGWIALLDAQNKVLDQLQYTQDMHFVFLPEFKGVALERVDAHLRSDWSGTWHSASYLCNYGTPARKNSQQKNLYTGGQYGFSVRSNLLSPNLDGIDDLMWIDYAFSQAGIVAHLDIYARDGVRVGKLWDGILLGTSGSYVWDGCLNGRRLDPGEYVLVIKYFSLQGSSSQAKIGVSVRW